MRIFILNENSMDSVRYIFIRNTVFTENVNLNGSGVDAWDAPILINLWWREQPHTFIFPASILTYLKLPAVLVLWFSIFRIEGGILEGRNAFHGSLVGWYLCLFSFIDITMVVLSQITKWNCITVFGKHLVFFYFHKNLRWIILLIFCTNLTGILIGNRLICLLKGRLL